MFEFEVTGEIGGMMIAAEGSVTPGECLLVTGPSGSGKTTLLRMLAGLHPITEGTVSLNGSDWHSSSYSVPTAERNIGFVFQNSALFPRMTALQNVAFGMPSDARPGAAEAVLEELGLAGRINTRASSLSGGERQRVALARAIARKPDLLLLDEPIASLDADNSDLAGAAISKTLAEMRIPAIVIAHSPIGKLTLKPEALMLHAGVPAARVPLAQAFAPAS